MLIVDFRNRLHGWAIEYRRNQEELSSRWQVGDGFEPKMSAEKREHLYSGWTGAVKRVLGD